MIIPLLIQLAMSCEHHLVMDDPYQFEHLTVDQLVDVHHLGRSQAIIREIEKRLEFDDLSRDDREILTKTLENK